MNDVVDPADPAHDPDRHARRERIRGAFTRAKDIFKKERSPDEAHDHTHNAGFKLSDDVNDFLAAGRKAAATATIKSVADNEYQEKRPQNYDVSPHSSTNDLINANARQTSPRGVPPPKLDLSQSQRWRNARPVEHEHGFHNDDHLSPPTYNNERHRYERSHSFNSALAKKGAKSRGLSVTFVNAPPIIIGEGGDEAPYPPCEISKARQQRSRSLSPYVERPLSHHSAGSNSPGGSRSPVRRKPVAPPHAPFQAPAPAPAPATNSEREDSIFQPRPIRRAQTGFNTQQVQTPYMDDDFAKQLNKALRLGGEGRQADPFIDTARQRNTGFEQYRGTPPQHQRQPLPPPQPPRPVNSVSPANAPRSSREGSNHSRPGSSPQRTSNPDLQQSSETSGKPAPMRVPNYYAQLRQDTNGQHLGSERHASPRSSPRSSVNERPQSMHDYESLSKNEAMSSQQDLAKRSQSTRQQPPEGWL